MFNSLKSVGSCVCHNPNMFGDNYGDPLPGRGGGYHRSHGGG